MGFGAAATAYQANAVVFDGSNDYLNRGGNLTGAANSNFFTASFWMKRGGSTSEDFYRCGGSKGIIIVLSAGDIRVTMVDTTQRLEYTFAHETDSAWHHYFIAIDMSNTGRRYAYIDGVAQSVTISTNSTDIIPFASATEHEVGGTSGGGATLNADLADVWIAPGQYIDPTVAANIRKFRSVAGKPVSLGLTGSNPTGTSPLIFFSGETVSWHTNKGTGGGFTENGALTTASTSPSD